VSGAAADGKPLKRSQAVEAALRDYRIADTAALVEGFAATLAPLSRGDDQPEEPVPGNGISAPGAPTTS
jgi:hypothetical protein